jgi:hypothetical protein
VRLPVAKGYGTELRCFYEYVAASVHLKRSLKDDIMPGLLGIFHKDSGKIDLKLLEATISSIRHRKIFEKLSPSMSANAMASRIFGCPSSRMKACLLF